MLGPPGQSTDRHLRTRATYVIIGGGGRAQGVAEKKRKATEEKNELNLLKNKQRYRRETFPQQLGFLPQTCIPALPASYTWPVKFVYACRSLG